MSSALQPAGSVDRPWERLDPELAKALAPSLPALADEVITQIGRAIPEYSRPLEGTFGEGLRAGVRRALQQFVELVGTAREVSPASTEVYRELGRGELRAGRGLDALQAAYRLGARVSWRRLSTIARAQGASAESISVLAESIFAYIDEVAASSVEGYAEAQAEAVGERERRRRRAMRLLIEDGERSRDPAVVWSAVAEAGWTLPSSIAVLVCDLPDAARLTTLLGPSAIGARLDELTCVLVEGSLGAADLERLRSALDRAGQGGWCAALGAAVSSLESHRSFARAKEAFELQRAGVLPGGFVRAEDHLLTLMLRRDAAFIEEFAARRMRMLRFISDGQRERLERTLLSWLQHRGSLSEVAAELHVHRQTVRYRLARLRELLGDCLDDPDARLEIELALRAAQARGRVRTPKAGKRP